MFVEAIKKMQKTMFPIFRMEIVSPTQTNIGVAGTGFFINDLGHFATVAHVFDGKTKTTKFLYLGLSPDNVVNPQLEIEEVSKDECSDIFIGKVKNLVKNKFVELGKSPNIGRTICISGYPLATIMANNVGGIDVSGVRRYFQPTFVIDHAKTKANNGAGIIREHDGFLIRDVGLFGMSGGPVFDINGKVVGIQASVTDPRVSQNGSGRSITIENAIAIKGDLIIKLAKRSKIKLGS